MVSINELSTPRAPPRARLNLAQGDLSPGITERSLVVDDVLNYQNSSEELHTYVFFFVRAYGILLVPMYDTSSTNWTQRFAYIVRPAQLTPVRTVFLLLV